LKSLCPSPCFINIPLQPHVYLELNPFVCFVSISGGFLVSEFLCRTCHVHVCIMSNFHKDSNYSHPSHFSSCQVTVEARIFQILLKSFYNPSLTRLSIF
jgi:hypothetical protein